MDPEQMQNSFDLLEVARQIYPSESYESYGVIINHLHLEALGLFDYIIQIQNEKVVTYNLKLVTDIMVSLYEQFKFDAILIPATWSGRMLAPRLAVRLQIGLTADVTEIRYTDDGALELIRPAFSGRLLAGIVNTGFGTVMMSVRQNVFRYWNSEEKETQIIYFSYEFSGESGIRQINIEEKVRSYDIRKSEILISGGGGIGRGFHKLDALAEALHGQVAASRQIVDKGIASRNIQVGQSGKTVSPKLYMALGIHGAIQHVEGLKNVANIISVNTNSSAPICSLSDLVVEDDAMVFIDLLLERIKKYRLEESVKDNI